ncbi:hypothetical protein [Ancylobacter amanitiformis]|uniref:Uncharacterized protein n=1 Tax=Ancylobacter amanitiformis TaxID=217069 RepID=A0ABU0LQG5_9HYPH|nr:hypothetical protein [Ancylobacter amanitiformis]MDQ0510914.1 hypothetical protein [Ancylobacter amanitiformis]
MKIETRAEAAQDAYNKVASGTHVVVPVALLYTLAAAGLWSYDPAWGGDASPAINAGRAAENILDRHTRLRQ